jgi:hypothetical protein
VFRKLFVCLLEAAPTLHAIPRGESQLLESLVLKFPIHKALKLASVPGEHESPRSYDLLPHRHLKSMLSIGLPPSCAAKDRYLLGKLHRDPSGKYFVGLVCLGLVARPSISQLDTLHFFNEQ